MRWVESRGYFSSLVPVFVFVEEEATAASSACSWAHCPHALLTNPIFILSRRNQFPNNMVKKAPVREEALALCSKSSGCRRDLGALTGSVRKSWQRGTEKLVFISPRFSSLLRATRGPKETNRTRQKQVERVQTFNFSLFHSLSVVREVIWRTVNNYWTIVKQEFSARCCLHLDSTCELCHLDNDTSIKWDCICCLLLQDEKVFTGRCGKFGKVISQQRWFCVATC